MPLQNPFAGWPTFVAALEQWGTLLLQPLAPVALTTWHDADPARRRFVGTLGAFANLDAASPAGADVGVQLQGTGNVVAAPPQLGAQIKWNSRNTAPGLDGLVVRGEFGLQQTVMPPRSGDLPVLFFELLPDGGAGQATSVVLGVEAVSRPSGLTLVLTLTAVDSPGPVRVRVGVATGAATAQTAKNVAAGGANVSAGFLADGGATSLAELAGLDVAALGLTVTGAGGGGAVSLPGQLRMEITIPTATNAGPTVTVSGATGLELDLELSLRDDTTAVRAGVSVPTLPTQLRAAITPDGAGKTAIAWSTGTAASPRSTRLASLEATVDVTPAAGDPLTLAATLIDVPPGLDIVADAGALSIYGVDAAGPSAVGAVRAELLSGTQTAPVLDDFIWLDLPAQSAAAQIRSLQTVEAAFGAGSPVTATVGFAERHALTGFLTAPGVRGNATIDALPTETTVAVDLANLAIGWAAVEPVESLAADITIVTTDEETGNGTGIVHVAAEVDVVPTTLDVEAAVDDLHLTFGPAAPERIHATIELAPATGWTPGDPPPALPAYDRSVDAELTGLPSELRLRANPDFSGITTVPTRLDWDASGDLGYAVVALDGFLLGPIAHLRARVGELPPELNVDLDLAGVTFDVRAIGSGRVGAIHVQASDRPIVVAGAASRRLDADIDARADGLTIAGVVRGLERATVNALPLPGQPRKLDVDLRFDAPGAFPGGFTATGPALRGRIRTDTLRATADAGDFPDRLSIQGDLDALTLDARLPLEDLDVDATGSIDFDGRTFAVDADVRASAVPSRIEASSTRDAQGNVSTFSYAAASRFTDLLLEAEVVPAPVIGMQHARAIVDLPTSIEVDVKEPRLSAVAGIAGFLRVRSSTDVPLPTTARRGQVLRVVTVPAAPSPDSLNLGSFGFVEAAAGKIEAFAGFRMTGSAGPAGGLTRLRGPRIELSGVGADQRIFASIQRRMGLNRLLRLAQVQLDIVRPATIDLRTTPGPLGEIGVKFPGPLRPVGTATTLGNFRVRMEPSYVGVPGGPPTGERDPAFVVPGLTLAGIGDLAGTVAAVPSHLEFALTTLGPFGTVATPLTISDPAGGSTLSVPSPWGGMRVDLLLDGNLAVRNLAATLYSLDWRREQRWQRISAGRIDVQPTGRTNGMTASSRTITLHQVGLEPTVANGGSSAMGLALAVPSNCPTNVSAVIRSAAFPRPPIAVPPTNPSGAFSSPIQVDVGRYSGFLGIKMGPGTVSLPEVVDASNAMAEWRIVAATPLGPAFLGNTGVVPLSLIAHIGLAVAAALAGELFLGPLGLGLGITAGVLSVEYFTAKNAPVQASLPAAAD